MQSVFLCPNMTFNIYINQIKALEWELNLQESVLFNYFHQLPTWAEVDPAGRIAGGQPYYYSTKSKILSELPMLTTKIDTIYRMIKTLVEKELIEVLKINNIAYYRVTKKGKSWNKGELGKKSDSSENNPLVLGNISDKTSENFPTYNNTIDNKTNNKDLSSPADKLKIKKDKFYKDLRAYQKEHPEKYPAGLYKKFINYWTEESKDQKKIRIDKEDFFNIGKRLSTFWGFTKQDEKNELWKEHNEAKQKQQPTLQL